METKHCYKASCYINNCWWAELLQDCSGSSHHWACNHADFYCVITAHTQNLEVSVPMSTSFFCFEKLLLTWNSRFLLKQPSRSLIMLMTFTWLRYQNKNIFLCLNSECFCLFDRPLLAWISRFFFKTNIYEPIMLSVWSRHQNKEIFVCFNVGCLCYFDKLFFI